MSSKELWRSPRRTYPKRSEASKENSHMAESKLQSPALRKTRRKGDDCLSPTQSPVNVIKKDLSNNLCSTPSSQSSDLSALLELDKSMSKDFSWADEVEQSFNSHTSPKRNRKQTEPQKRSTKPKYLRNLMCGGGEPESKATDEPDAVQSPLRRSPRKRCRNESGESGNASPTKKSRPNNMVADTDRPPSASLKAHYHLRFPLTPEWKDPKLGWVQDDAVIKRREKDIMKGKDSASYRSYVIEIPKEQREKGVHPRTPNKYLNYSRRSWDMQVRKWRKEIHVWAGDSISDMSSLNGSFSSHSNYTTDSETGSNADPEETSYYESYQSEPDGGTTDGIGNILTQFDIDSRRGFKSDGDTLQTVIERREEEGDDTLIGTSTGHGGPVDFSGLAAAS